MVEKIENIKIWSPDGFHEGALFVENGRFAEEKHPDTVTNGEGLFACPGLIDVHTHGRIGGDFCTADVPLLEKMALDYARRGVTALLPTFASAAFPEWQAAVARVCAAKTPAFVGLHLEGRYLSPVRRGAHAPELLVAPNADEVETLRRAIAPLPLRVTFAPETDKNGDFCRAAARAGVSLSMGHTDADYATALAAIKNGVVSATHLFNTMPPLHHRAGGAVAAALTEPIFAELIVDGKHIAPEMVRLAYLAKGAEKLVLISDSMEGTGCPDGEYNIAGQVAYLRDGEAMTADGHLAGSTLDLLDGVKNLAAFAGVSFEKALLSATLAPAKLLGKENELGTLRAGARADLLLLDDLCARRRAPRRVMQAGVWL